MAPKYRWLFQVINKKVSIESLQVPELQAQSKFTFYKFKFQYILFLFQNTCSGVHTEVHLQTNGVE